ncbi:G-protein coupled receptor Mth2-like [Phlebotomus argentipes]|uniref:G-protein coupled receptor Mth2-like n=1 Tax=Phlebotomus argentipes TaxID=94469 RepID=UPI0028933382|nr:G-protein coupled receptor Mth2-like [Phlebotomus argentipes]
MEPLRVILIVMILLTWPSVQGRLKKCCPRGFEFSVIVNEEGRQSYDCMPDRENITVFNDEDFFGDFSAGVEKSSFPTCSERRLQLFRFTRELISVSPNSCVDVIQGDYILLTCSSKQPIPDALTVLSVRKCCGQDSIYDTKVRECVFPSDAPLFENSSLRSLLPPGSSPLFIRGVPQCQKSEVMVMYTSSSHEIAISGPTLMITTFDRGRPVTEYVDPDAFCLDSSPTLEDDSRWMVRVCQHENICQRIPCVRKCCGHEEKMAKVDGRGTCLSHPVDIFPIFHILDGEEFPEIDPPTFQPKEFGIRHGQECEKYILDAAGDPRDNHYFNSKTGNVHLDNLDPIPETGYCVDYVEFAPDFVQLRTFLCFETPPGHSKEHFMVYAIGLSISCLFLAATLLVYACLPKLMNLHGKTLVSHVLSLLIAYAGLSYIQFGTDFQPKFCHTVAMFIYFSFLAAFSWLNVMCFDIWWTFGTVRNSRGMRKTRDAWRFACYSFYAWGIPLVLTLFTYAVDSFQWFPEEYRPNMGVRSCWFSQSNGLGHRLFFLLPVGIQIVANVVLFVLTTIHCNKVKSEIHRMQKNDSEKKKRFFADKARLVMNVKLFIVMGVSWFMELLATIFKEPIEMWYVSDAFNVLQGVCVFLIFVFKRNVLQAIKRRFGMVAKSSREATAATTKTTITGSAQHICSDPHSPRYGKLSKNSSSSSVTISTTNNCRKF